jgi:hypothetical protein
MMVGNTSAYSPSGSLSLLMKLLNFFIMVLCSSRVTAFVGRQVHSSTMSFVRRIRSGYPPGSRRLSASSPSSPSTSEPLSPRIAKEKRYQEAREKRRKFIGMAKAVDRGQFAVTYNPRQGPHGTFQALSGLPDRTKLFTVLGIESSCDDTGAAVIRSDGVILGDS